MFPRLCPAVSARDNEPIVLSRSSVPDSSTLRRLSGPIPVASRALPRCWLIRLPKAVELASLHPR